MTVLEPQLLTCLWDMMANVFSFDRDTRYRSILRLPLLDYSKFHDTVVWAARQSHLTTFATFVDRAIPRRR